VDKCCCSYDVTKPVGFCAFILHAVLL
jgi:hypothetical protein